MKNRRYVLVIMDWTGRSVRRVGVARRSIELLVGGVALLLIVAAVLTVHGLLRRDDAREARLIKTENVELTELLANLEGRLPDVRRFAMRSEIGFAQLWAKSGVGFQARTLAVGPHEETDNSGLSFLEVPAASMSGDMLNLDPVALPFETERIRTDARILQHQLAGLLTYFNDAERLLSHTPSVRPTMSPWLTSSFGRRRDPMNGHLVMHKGLDMGGYIGMEITAPADGVAIFVGRRGGYGQTVVINHGFGIQTHFAHLNRYRVRKGQRVHRGDIIAEMGSTGKSTGPHLHYEVRRAGQPLDPRFFILD